MIFLGLLERIIGCAVEDHLADCISFSVDMAGLLSEHAVGRWREVIP